ncbi:MAG: 50S ribosomal protein L14 [Candidatus Heimdallarchaeota archaeon]
MKKRKALRLVTRRITRALPTGAKVQVADNSGARIVQVISVKGHKTRLRRQPAAKVGDLIVCSVKKGTPKLRRQIVHGVVIRQKKPYKRADGSWVHFEDNAIVVTNENGEPRGTEIRGAVSKEAADSWPRIASAARIIA